MAKNVTIANVDYSNVPSIEVPLTAGGGNAKFVEISATTATADKILTGYGAYSSSGVWMDGTATGGGGSGAVIQDQDGYVVLDDEEEAQITVEPLSVTQNGTYTAPANKAYSPVTVNVSGIEFLWPTRVYIETIEANSITNTYQAKAYFDNKYSSYVFAILLSDFTVNNQVVMMGLATCRWRGGAVVGTTVGTNYDGKLVEGSQYVILSTATQVNNATLLTEQDFAEAGRILLGYEYN